MPRLPPPKSDFFGQVSKDPRLREGLTTSDFSMSPAVLVLVAEAIAKVSGLDVANIFTKPHDRHLTTLEWAVRQLEDETQADTVDARVLEKIRLLAEKLHKKGKARSE